MAPYALLGVIAVLAAVVVFAVARSDPGNGGAGETGQPQAAPAAAPTSTQGPSISKEAPASPPPDGVALPDGSNLVDGYPTGFPHSDLGPVAAQAALAQAQIGFDYDQAARIAGIYAAPGAREALVDRSHAAVRLRRRQAGVPADGSVPGPASYALTPVAFTVTELDTDYYAVSLLSYVTLVTADGTARDSLYAGTGLFRWIGGDWKVVEGAPADLARLLAQGQPAAAAPGTPEFTEAGWNLIAGQYQ